MKVLILARWYPNDEDPQLGVFVQKHVQAIAEFADVWVVAAFPRQGLKEIQVRRTVHPNYTEILVYYPARQGIMALPAYRKSVLHVVSQLEREGVKPDLIHAHVLLRTFVIARILSLRWKIPYFITDHWTGYLFGNFKGKPLVYRWLSRYLIRHAAAVSLVSASLVQAFRQLSLKNKDIRIIPNIVDFPEVKKPERKPGPIRILSVADLADTNKNISGVLLVLDQLAEELPDFEYSIVGGGPDEEALKSLALSLRNLRKRVHFQGRVPNSEVFGILEAADFLIVNSRVETFSVITAEAIALGVPVIATISGGPEFIIRPESGILIPANDSAALAEAIRSMVHRYTHYNYEVMRNSIQSLYSRDTIARAFKAMYLDHLKT